MSENVIERIKNLELFIAGIRILRQLATANEDTKEVLKLIKDECDLGYEIRLLKAKAAKVYLYGPGSDLSDAELKHLI